MGKYEVWGYGYDAEGVATGMKHYGTFDGPGAALVFAHSIDAEWLKEHGNLDRETSIDIEVQLCTEDGYFADYKKPLWSGSVCIYHRMNSGLQPTA